MEFEKKDQEKRDNLIYPILSSDLNSSLSELHLIEKGQNEKNEVFIQNCMRSRSRSGSTASLHSDCPQRVDDISTTYTTTKRGGTGILQNQNQDENNGGWRRLRPNLLDKNEYLMETGILSDVQFIVGDRNPEAFNCHKWILILSSPVFEKMFLNWNLKGHISEGAVQVIRVPDIEPKAFECFIKFIYTEKLEIPMKEALGIMYAARKYDIPSLIKNCGDFLKTKVTEEDAILIFLAARLLDIRELEVKSEDFIIQNFWQIIKTDSFYELTQENLIHFLSKDELNCKELELFDAVSSWATDQCLKKGLDIHNKENHRNILGPVINYIRYPTLTQKIFSQKIVPSGLLPEESVIQLFQYFTGLHSLLPKNRKGNTTSILALKTNFNTKPRKSYTANDCKSYNVEILNPGNAVLLSKCDEWIIDRFQVSQNIRITSLGFMVLKGGDFKYPSIELAICKRKTAEQIIYKYYQNKTGRGNTFMRLPFEDPVNIVKNTKYELFYKIKYDERQYLSPPTDALGLNWLSKGTKLIQIGRIKKFPVKKIIVEKLAGTQRLEFIGKNLSGIFGEITFEIDEKPLLGKTKTKTKSK